MNVQEWRNHNHYRNYPFKEDASRLSGAFELPVATLLDFGLVAYLQDIGDQTVKLTKLEVAAGGVSLTFTFEFGGYYEIPIVISGATVTPYEGETRIDLNPGTAWVVMRPLFGPGIQEIVQDVSTHGNTYLFDDLPIIGANTAEKPSSLLTSVIADEAPVASSVSLDGDVKFGDGYNVSVRVSQVTNTIKFLAKVGAGRGVPCTPMLPDPADCKEGIYYINGQHPNWEGKFNLTAGNGIRIDSDPDNNKIIISSPLNPDNPRCED